MANKKETTAIAKAQSGVLKFFDSNTDLDESASAIDIIDDVEEDLYGYEDVGKEDLIFSNIKVLQLTSDAVAKGEARQGQLLDVSTGKAYDELECILLKLTKFRTLWGKPYAKGDDPLCKSFDLQKGTKYGECAKCKYSKYNREEDATNCFVSYAWIGMLNDKEKTPFRIMAIGKSVEKTRKFLTALRKLKKSLYNFKVILKTEREENNKGTYYVLKYDCDIEKDSLVTLTMNDMGISTDDIIKNKKEYEKYARILAEYTRLNTSDSEPDRAEKIKSVKVELDKAEKEAKLTISLKDEIKRRREILKDIAVNYSEMFSRTAEDDKDFIDAEVIESSEDTEAHEDNDSDGIIY